MKHGALTVRELIEQLSQLDPELPVLSDGCDCYGEAVAVRTLEPDSPGWLHGTGAWVVISRTYE